GALAATIRARTRRVAATPGRWDAVRGPRCSTDSRSPPGGRGSGCRSQARRIHRHYAVVTGGSGRADHDFRLEMSHTTHVDVTADEEGLGRLPMIVLGL